MTDDTAGKLAEEQEDGNQRRCVLRLVPAAIVVAGLAFGYLAGWHHYLTLEYLGEQGDALKALVGAKPLLSAAAFVAVYAAVVAFAFPAASVLTVFGGFLFGCTLGSVLTAFAATAGATVLFLVARTAFGDFLKNKVGSRAERLAKGFESNAFSYLLALRLIPLFPFFLVNIAPALFNVRLRTFIAATFLGILPGVVAYSYLGVGVGSVLAAAQQAGREATLADLVTPQITIAFAALALVALLPVVVKTVRNRGS
ncbi:TVP38/TMEM64 family protein [Aquamicrobium sp. LC103]|uniref:TVP38/TMEM64 family protein n=1 Tax=Aquamicrobium sp. LC103 TaxID=1120658 RepID=UPI00063E842D|nr:TVP38/TMEM64 family protein [Aquamicrobium sp. LC103]TKT75095.1 TVP38/TMEM64 family protein [Aquamicrobium sp. LC103]